MSDAASRDEHWDRAGRAIAEVVKTGTAAFATIGDPNLYSTFAYVAHAVRALVPDVIDRDRPRHHRDAGSRRPHAARSSPRATSGSR